MTPIKSSVLPILGNLYISRVNGARKVKSDAQVAMNKNSYFVQKFFLRGGWEGQCPQLKFFQSLELSETSRARKLIFGLHVDKANSRRYDVTQ